MLINFLKTEAMKRSYMTTTFFGGKNDMKKRITLITDKSPEERERLQWQRCLPLRF